jgi:hypothetical protein
MMWRHLRFEECLMRLVSSIGLLPDPILAREARPGFKASRVKAAAAARLAAARCDAGPPK